MNYSAVILKAIRTLSAAQTPPAVGTGGVSAPVSPPVHPADAKLAAGLAQYRGDKIKQRRYAALFEEGCL